MLVVSDPPHGAVKAAAAAEILGLPTDNARLKVRFGAPEVLAAADPDRAVDVAIALKATGLNVEMREGEWLAELPWPTRVSSFEFCDAGLRVEVEDGALDLLYHEPVFGVFCEPPEGFVPPPGWAGPPPHGTILTGPAAADALEWVPHLDLYVRREDELRRVAIDGPSMVAMVAECAARFSAFDLDARLQGVRPRRRFRAGEQGFDLDMRKRYAFGTLLLRHALESIAPELRDVTQYELGSRLAYVLRRGART
jgi:hypothetical protein